jgi:hypothetical protein
MPQTSAPLPAIPSRRCPDAFIIAPAMLNTIEHHSNARFRLVTDYSSDSTHDEEK